MIPSFYYLRVVHEIALICDMYKIRELQYQSNYQLNTNATYELSRDVGRGSTKSTKRSVSRATIDVVLLLLDFAFRFCTAA